jgi:hypothetical protein
MSLFQAVPAGFLLTSGANSALTWTNAVSVSSMNVSSLASNNLSVSTLTTSTSINASTLVTSSITANSVGYSTLSGSTINSTRLNYSSIVGSSISSNTLTLSLTNASTQNTQIYQVATTNPTTSYTVIQASHVSTGTTNNALALNPSGGNVGVGTTAPGNTLDVNGSTQIRGSFYAPNTNNPLGATAGNSTLVAQFGPGGSNDYGRLNLYGVRNTSGSFFTTTSAMLRYEVDATNFTYMGFNQSGVGINTTTPGATLDVAGTMRINTDTAAHLLSETPGTGPNYFGFKSNGTVYGYIGLENSTGGGLFGGNSPFAMSLGTISGSNVNIAAGNAIRFVAGNTGIIYFPAYTTNGTLSIINSAGQIGQSSDRRIKENIVYQSDTQQGLSSILNLKPATFNMIGSPESHLGFIAQDLEQDIPLAVDGKKYEWQWEEEDGKPKFDANGDIVYKLDADGNRIVRPRGVSDRAIIATQTLAIQELSKKLDAKSAALDSLLAWAQTMGYSPSV